MTLRELFPNIGNWFFDGGCKFLLNTPSICKEWFGRYGELNWLDFTIGQALFTLLPLLVFVVMPILLVIALVEDD